MIVFDIETGPLPESELKTLVDPFEPPPHPGEFDPASVKYGQLKDEAKRAAKLEDARKKHAAAVARHEQTCKEAEEASWADVKSKAALSAITGQVLAIGYLSTDTGRSLLDIHAEPVILTTFWKRYEQCRRENRQLVGHNIHHFDVPFLIRRSWVHGIDIPSGVLERGKWIDSKTLVDTMQLWACGGRDWAGLDRLARLFGIGGKPDGVDGSMFADLLHADRKAAEAYLRNDLEMTRGVAERMGLV